jgi:hypothetical protein
VPASYLEAVSVGEVAGESHGRCLEDNVLWPEGEGRVGRGERNGELGQLPVAVRSAGGTEDLPKGWQVRRIDDVDGVLGHLGQPFGDLAVAHTLTSVKAITRSGLSASTMRDLVNPIWRPI